jgi:hypothetical protein
MIKQKRSFAKREFEVNEDFIDRGEAKDLFRKKMEHNDKDYNILTFYGVGGIGKSKLMKEICRIHEEENKDAVTLYLDLNAAEDRSFGSGILKLVDSCTGNIDFRCFELAYALYFRKKHPGISYGHEKACLTENKFIGIGLNIIGILDNGVTATAAEIAEKTIRAIHNRTIDKTVKEALKTFDDNSAAEMEEMLPLFLQYDLSCYTKKHKDAKILIVFDTFEALNENVIEQVHKSINERWIRDFISYFGSAVFSNLLILIFGRDEIEWEQEWMEVIDRYRLTEFDEKYSREYLEAAGIDEPGVTDAIIQSSKGFPFLLYLSLETYVNIKNRNGEVSQNDFNGSYPEIIERFLYNLDKDTVEILRLTSVPNLYNAEICKRLAQEYNVSFPMTEFEQFNKYSFVTKDIVDDDYYIHDLMRRGIIDKSPKALIAGIHGSMKLYYAEKLTEGINRKYMIELFYHARNCMDAAQFNKWITEPLTGESASTPLKDLKKVQERGEQNLLLQIIDGIRQSYDLSLLAIDIANIYIDALHLGGEYELAVKICDAFLDRRQDKVSGDEQLMKMRIRKLHHSMFFTPVDILIKEAESILEEQSIRDFPEQYNELLFLLGGNLGLLSGNMDRAEKWLECSMKCAKEHDFPSFAHRTIRKQADIRLAKDDFEGALALVGEVIPLCPGGDEIDSRYKIYLVGALGEIHRKRNEIDKAFRCYDIVGKEAGQNHIPGWKAHAFLGKGMCHMQCGRYDAAAGEFGKARALYSKINQMWGQINVASAEILMGKLQGLPIDKEQAERWGNEAARMNYQYNVDFLSNMESAENPYLQLFFL